MDVILGTPVASALCSQPLVQVAVVNTVSTIMVGDVSVSLQAGQTVVVINFVDTGIVFGFS